MATFRKRGSRWQVQVRRQGLQPVSKSFLLKTDAQAWARQQETLADRGQLPVAGRGTKKLKTMTVADVLSRYQDEVMPTHRGGDRLIEFIGAFLRRPIATTKLAGLTITQAQAYVAERLKTVRPGTINRERRAEEIARAKG